MDTSYGLKDHVSRRVVRTPCGGWLRSLGLEQYEAAFRENEKVLRQYWKPEAREQHSGLSPQFRLLHLGFQPAFRHR
jgi:hypothetical protein